MTNEKQPVQHELPLFEIDEENLKKLKSHNPYSFLGKALLNDEA